MLMGTASLEVVDLGVKYGKTIAVSSASFSAVAGDRIAVLGQNGAGKSSLLGAVANVISFGGLVRVDDSEGNSLEGYRVRKAVGYVPSHIAVPSGLTVLDCLHYYAWLRRMPHAVAEGRARQLLRSVGLEEMSRKRGTALSTGQGKRLGLAVALMDSPTVLVLDEFTNGVDEFHRDTLLRLAGCASVVILASHMRSEVAELATRVLTMRSGRIVDTSVLEVDAHRRVGQIEALFAAL
jgi:ABC-type multidrug transport system ATPase subunit